MRKQYASINDELNSLAIYKDKECSICGRKHPNTILNIEGVIHHREPYRCIDYKSCRRTKLKTIYGSNKRI
jgi:hypothetical protein